MANRTVNNQRARGSAVLERLTAESVPAVLKAPAKDFKDAHRDLDRASEAVEEARGARDAALEALATADSTLDGHVDSLADSLVGAGLGKRKTPLASFTKRTVSELVSLAYATEAKEVREVCVAIRKKKPVASVGSVVARCEKQLDVVERAIAALDKPQAAYAKALAKRDVLLPEWTRKLARLKRHAAVAWEEEPELLKATFAEPGLIAAPKVRRRKASSTADVAPPTNGAGPAPAMAATD